MSSSEDPAAAVSAAATPDQVKTEGELQGTSEDRTPSAHLNVEEQDDTAIVSQADADQARPPSALRSPSATSDGERSQRLRFGSTDGMDEADGVTFAADLQRSQSPDSQVPAMEDNMRMSKLTRGTSSAGRSMSNMSIRATLGGNVDLSWHHVSVTLPKDEKNKRPNPKIILDNISGRIEGGSLMALMGASGAGKTTFLNLISGRVSNVLDVEGVLGINGRAVTPNLVRKIAAYIQQQDVFLGNLTVYEHLYIQAMLRMDSQSSTEERVQQIEKVMDELSLAKIRNTRIGNPVTGTRGISGGEAKRLAFASEILTDPPLLFADEPTSGLDSFAARNVVNGMKTLADNGRTIICTIHQPPSEVFLLFNRLLLFAEGRTAFLGNINTAPSVFASLGYPCPANYNHADFYIHTLAIVPGKEDECRARVKTITDAYHEKEVQEGSLQDPEPATQQLVDTLREMSHRRIQPIQVQIYHVLKRSFLTSIREFQVVVVQLMQTLVMALVFGLVYLQIDSGHDMERSQNFAGAVMMVVVSSTFTTLYPVVQVLPTQAVILIRDHDNHMYGTWIFYMSKFLAEIPISVVYQFLFSVITYFMIGFRVDATAFFIYYGYLLMAAMIARALGFFISACAFDNAQLALSLVTPIAVPFMLFSGVFLNADAVPKYLIWLDALSMFKYEWEGLMINEFDGLQLANCTAIGIMNADANVTTLTRCFNNGNEILEQFSLKSGISQINFDMGIMIALFAGYLILGLLIIMYHMRHLKR